MMTKYQIVVTKLQTTVWNIARTTEARKKLRVSVAFKKMAEAVKIDRQRREAKQRLVGVLFETKLARMLSVIQRYSMHKMLTGRITRWKNFVEMAKLNEQSAKQREGELQEVEAKNKDFKRESAAI